MTRQSINLCKKLLRRRWMRGSSPRMTAWLWIPACALPSGACEPRLLLSFRRDHVQPLAFAFRTRLVAPEPDLDAVEIKIDHRRGVERKQLAQREAADHGVAERLAQLRSGAVAERERK